MTTKLECKHNFESLRIRKFFIKDNGGFGGQTLEVLVDCEECKGTGFLYQYRGNVPDMYIQPNTFLTRPDNEGHCEHIKVEMEPTFA